MGKFSRTFSLLRASWNILRDDEEMLLFPVMALVVTILFYTVLILVFWSSFFSFSHMSQTRVTGSIWYYVILFVIYFCNYVIAVFFNSAVVACAYVRMNGKHPTISFAFRAAWSRIHLIIAWSLFASSIGLLFNILEQWLGRLVTGIFEIGWTLASFLVIPIFVVEQKGPVDALKESAALLKKTWGESLISGVSFGLIGFLLAIPAFIFMMIVMSMVGPGLQIPVVVVVIFYFAAVFMIITVLKTIFQVALYQYARTNSVPNGFDENDLQGAISSKWSK